MHGAAPDEQEHTAVIQRTKRQVGEQLGLAEKTSRTTFRACWPSSARNGGRRWPPTAPAGRTPEHDNPRGTGMTKNCLIVRVWS